MRTDESARWCRTHSALYAPFSIFNNYRGQAVRRLDRHWVGHDWYVGWSFVAFRPVS